MFGLFFFDFKEVLKYCINNRLEVTFLKDGYFWGVEVVFDIVIERVG